MMMLANRKPFELLNIHAGEERLVSLFITFYFFLGVGFVLTQTAAFALFLKSFPAQMLPYSYIAIAVFVPAISYMYLKLGDYLSFDQQLLVNVAFLMVGNIAIWLGAAGNGFAAVFFSLPVWFQLVINLGLIAFWSLAGTTFDVRQSKRLFGLLGFGYWLAYTIGGFLVPTVVAFLGTATLLLIGGLSFGVALYFLRQISQWRMAHHKTAAETQTAASSTPTPEINLWQNDYIRYIFAIVILWWIAFFFLDNVFYDLAAQQFPDADELASFIGLLMAAVGIVGLLVSVFLVRPLIDRYGVRTGLLVTPAVVAAFLLGLAISGTLNSAVVIVFAFAALAKLSLVSLGFSIDQSARILLYQPLPVVSRIKAQTTVDGIIQPVAIGLAGVLLLLFFNTALSLNATQVTYLLLLVIAGWVAFTFVIGRGYVDLLKQSLIRRRWQGTETNFIDKNSTQLLYQYLTSPHPEQVIYAFDLLMEHEPYGLNHALSGLLNHPSEMVRESVLRYIETRTLHDYLPQVQKLTTADSVPEVREAAYKTWAAIGRKDDLFALLPHLEQDDPVVLRGTLIGLLRHGSVDGILAAGQTLTHLLESQRADLRALAAQILGEAGLHAYYQPLLNLFYDEDKTVRAAALTAAGRLNHHALWPAVLDILLTEPTLRQTAVQTLMQGGEACLPMVQQTLQDKALSRANHLALIRVCEKIGTPTAVELLGTQQTTADLFVRTAVLQALYNLGYRAPTAAETMPLVEKDLDFGAFILAALAELESNAAAVLVTEALQSNLQRTQERLLNLLAFTAEPIALARAKEALKFGTETQHAYALEILDVTLPNEIKRDVLPLLEDRQPTPKRLKRMHRAIALPMRHGPFLLVELIEHPALSPWAKAVALYTLTTTFDKELGISICHRLENSQEPLLAETAAQLLAKTVPASTNGTNNMSVHNKYSTIERVMILKTADIFATIPNNVLAQVASILEEVTYPADHAIFAKGDLGHSMYVVVNGRVRVHDGDLLLNYLEDGNIFGEMALLDPEPRLASVTTAAETTLFRLEQNAFYELMADQPAVAQGIIRVLTRHLRNRVRDLAALDAKLQKLAPAS